MKRLLVFIQDPGMKLPLCFVYFAKIALSLHNAPSKTLVGYQCTDPIGAPIDVQQNHCYRPKEIVESSSDQRIALIHQQEESKIRGDVCNVQINKIRYICRLCEGGNICKKEKTNTKVPFVISPQQCRLLISARVFTHEYDLYGTTHFSSFSNIQQKDEKKSLLFGHINNKGVCQGVHIEWDNVDYPGTIIELVFKFELSSVVLNWFPRVSLLTYNQASITYSPEGHSKLDQGIIIFDKAKLDCSLSYTQRIFTKQSKLNIQGKVFDLLYFNKTEVLEIHRLGNEFNTCLNLNLTILRGSMFLCQNCNLKLKQLLPEEEARISSESIRVDTLDGLQLELIRHGMDELEFNLCLVRNHISRTDPSFILNNQHGKNPLKVVFRHGQNYLIKCKKVGISLNRNLKKCFESLPVIYKNNSYFLNHKSNILESQSPEINCGNMSQSFYKVKTNFMKPTYFCNPPSYNECGVQTETIEKSRKSQYKFNVGQLFQPRHYVAKLNKILLSAKTQQKNVFQNNFKDTQITHSSMGTFPEGSYVPSINFKDWTNSLMLHYFQSFIQKLPDPSRISSLIVMFVIVLEWTSHCYLNNSLCFVNLIILGLFIFCPFAYLAHLYWVRPENRHHFAKNRSDEATQDTEHQ